MRPVYTVQLYRPRPNVPVSATPARDIWAIVQFATCLFLYGVILILVMA